MTSPFAFILAFLLGSPPLVIVSWKALLHPRSHGFPRFFAWEILLALFLLNAGRWFHDPLSWNQLLSWGLLLTATAPLWRSARISTPLAMTMSGI